MATTLSTVVSDANASPLKRGDRRTGGLQQDYSMTTEAGVLALNDVHILCPVDVDATISSLELATDDLGTTGDLDLGLFAQDPIDHSVFTAVDQDAFAAALDVNAAAVPFTDRRFSLKNIDTINKKVWELAGLAKRPAYRKLFIGVTAVEATTAAGTISLRMRLKGL